MSKLQKFRALGLSEEMIQALEKKGFEEPTPIQEKVIPVLLENKFDVIGQAQTGTGKTAAFGLPILEKIKPSKKVKVIILTPTRELAIQVSEEISSFRGKKKLKVLPVYGGQSMEQQIRHLKEGVDVIVGTPGRIVDHLRRKTLNFKDLEYCVIDEADELLNMGFLEEMSAILEATPASKRTLLFSATMPPEVLGIAEEFMGLYEILKVEATQLTVEKTEQIYFQVAERDKFEALCRIMDMEEEFFGLVFVRTRVDCDKVANRLIDRGYDAEAIHGDLSQSQREKVMGKFKKRRVNILVATDVAARGIDVTDLTHVINYALPQDPEAYVHRIGRTGRAGKEGTAITFITPTEEKKLLDIERKTNANIRREKMPQVKDVIKAKKDKIKSLLDGILEKGTDKNYKEMAAGLLGDNDPETIIAALLKYSFDEELDPENYNHVRDAQPKIPGNTRLFIAKGKKDRMTPKKLIDFVTRNTAVSPKKIGDIQIQNEFSFMNVPLKEAEIILKQFKKANKGKRSLVEIAKPKD